MADIVSFGQSIASRQSSFSGSSRVAITEIEGISMSEYDTNSNKITFWVTVNSEKRKMVVMTSKMNMISQILYKAQEPNENGYRTWSIKDGILRRYGNKVTEASTADEMLKDLNEILNARPIKMMIGLREMNDTLYGNYIQKDEHLQTL